MASHIFLFMYLFIILFKCVDQKLSEITLSLSAEDATAGLKCASWTDPKEKSEND